MASTAMVPHPSWVDRRDLVVHGVGGALGEPVEAKLERLREDREAHSRKQIWTKDPHGGPYRKVNANAGYDPLIQLPDGSERPAELGFERAKTGPTSNFVGNHMTQGAIDLVQAQLEPAATPALLKGGGSPRAPQLLGMAAAAPDAAPPSKPLCTYRWRDAGRTVRLEVPLTDLRLGGPGGTVACSIRAQGLELEIAAAPAPLPSGDGGQSAAAEMANGRTACASQPPSHRLLLQPLHAAVVPARSRCYLEGLLALPPCSGGGNPDESSPPVTKASGTGDSHPGQRCISFALLPGAAALVVELAKADVQRQWDALQASLPLAVPAKAAAGGGGPDITSLRRLVRQQLGRAPLPAPEAGDREAEAAAAAVQADATPPLPSAERAARCKAALHTAKQLEAAGQHAEALAATAACMILLPTAAADGLVDLAVQLHALRGRCHAESGCLKEAVVELTAGIELLVPTGPATAPPAPGQLAQLLLVRAALLEQQEKPEAALADALTAAALHDSRTRQAALLAAQRLRRAVQ